MAVGVAMSFFVEWIKDSGIKFSPKRKDVESSVEWPPHGNCKGVTYACRSLNTWDVAFYSLERVTE